MNMIALGIGIGIVFRVAIRRIYILLAESEYNDFGWWYFLLTTLVHVMVTIPMMTTLVEGLSIYLPSWIAGTLAVSMYAITEDRNYWISIVQNTAPQVIILCLFPGSGGFYCALALTVVSEVIALIIYSRIPIGANPEV